MLITKSKLSTIFTSIACFCMISTASASVPGFYIGGQLGWGWTHQWIDGNFLLDALVNSILGVSKQNDGIAGGALGGYQFNRYFAVETGYTKFSDANLTINRLNANEKIKTYALDVVVKGIVPLRDNLGLFGKLGGAYLNETVSGNFSDNLTIGKIYPTFGAGINYDLSQKLSTDISWIHIQGVGSSDNPPSTDFLGWGLTYHFG